MLQGARGQNCEQQGDRLSSAEGNRKEFEVASRSRRINSCEIEGVKAPVGERTAAELMYSFVKSAVKLNFERRAANTADTQAWLELRTRSDRPIAASPQQLGLARSGQHALASELIPRNSSQRKRTLFCCFVSRQE